MCFSCYAMILCVLFSFSFGNIMCKGCKEHIHTYSHMHPQQCRNNEMFVVGSQIADAVELKRCFPFLFLILGALEIVLVRVFVSSSKRKVCALVSSSIQLIKWVLSILHMHTYTRTYIHCCSLPFFFRFLYFERRVTKHTQ